MVEIALFPLPLVLLPGGRLPLQIFETRYLDMVKHCMRDKVGFGVILIEEGQQILQHTHQLLPKVVDCGTYCTIVDFDQEANSLLQITAEGQVKFSVRSQYASPEKLVMAEVEFLPLEDAAQIPENKQHLANLLASLLEHEMIQRLNLSINFEDARDVGGRLTELLPCSRRFKQQMLEMQDPIQRLVALEAVIDKIQESRQ